eukprot:322838_1
MAMVTPLLQSASDVHLNKHNTIVILDPRFHCTYKDCSDNRGRGFTSKLGLTNHVNCVHLKKKNYECRICNKRFYDKYNCRSHVRTHTG